MTGRQIALEYAAERHAAEGTGRRIREQAEVTMTLVAKVIGVSLATLHRWETGETTPSGPEAARWATLLERLETAKTAQLATAA